MKLSILIPIVASLPATTYAWNIGTKCCEFIGAYYARQGYGCAQVDDHPYATVTNLEPLCYRQCKKHTNYGYALRAQKTEKVVQGRHLCVCIDFDSTSQWLKAQQDEWQGERQDGW
ncbi:hypothetical protein FKW77_004460 [Venturia effusa]|uniref:Uncharacterized protein n=1 Tax=Venturia effusa TaxID=50376 RepID=A0A517L599_9PEZI|nr:hypothetical protein FKW77_004460 [Venturia effusa]